jgi:hypothetical protein
MSPSDDYEDHELPLGSAIGLDHHESFVIDNRDSHYRGCPTCDDRYSSGASIR